MRPTFAEHHFQLRYTYNEAQGTNFQSPKEIKERVERGKKIKLLLKIHFSQQSSPISINEYLENSSVANYRFFAKSERERCENAKKLDYIILQNGVSLQIALNFLVLNYQRKFSGAVQFECKK